MKSYTCLFCGKIFNSKKGCKSREPKYCSKTCFGESKKLNIKCKLCGKIIENKHSVSIKNRIYCGKECQSLARKNIKFSEEWKNAISEGRKKSEKCKGKNLYNWKGGKDTEKFRLKTSFYKRKNSLKLKLDANYLKSLIIAQENKCFFCESDLTQYKAIEHLTPVSKNGDNQNYNIVYSCKSCNSKKRQQTLEEYAINNKRFDLIDKFDYVYSSTLLLIDKMQENKSK